jgi:hypothetical protein
MEVIRLRSDDILIPFDGYDPETEYKVELIDTLNGDSFEQTLTTDDSGTMSFDLLAESEDYRIHDGFFNALVSEYTGTKWVVVGQETVDVVRPYANYQQLAADYSISEAQALRSERIARHVINSRVAGGFYYVRNNVVAYGFGADYLPLDQPIWGIESIKENRVEIWNTIDDWSVNYVISPDRSAIVEEQDYDLENYRPVWYSRFSAPAFPDGYEYVVQGSFGWPSIPTDVKDAAALLIDDIQCNNFRYMNKYIQTFETDAFKIRYAKLFSETTGNKIVDDLLDKYIGSIRVKIL